jgi:hypothetical protein
MTDRELENLKYPIGNFESTETLNLALVQSCISEIESLPAKLKKEVEHFSDAQLDTPYRPGGWTIRQVVHHLADSHMNSLIRFKLALTEDNPVIKPYLEDKWAELADSKLPVNISLQLLEGLHIRLFTLLKSLSPEELNRTYIHPESKKQWRLYDVIGLYAWHGNHHLAHITSLAFTQ